MAYESKTTFLTVLKLIFGIIILLIGPVMAYAHQVQLLLYDRIWIPCIVGIAIFAVAIILFESLRIKQNREMTI
jgi:hypothetical protein